MAWILTTQMPPDAAGGEVWLWISLAFLAGFLLCLIIGLITGLIIAVIGVHPILVTLGTQTLIAGISIWLTRGQTLSGFPDALIHISNETVAGIPISFGIFAVVAIGVHVLPDAVGARHSDPYDWLQSRIDTILGSKYTAGTNLGLCAVKLALLAGGNRDDGTFQFRGSRYCPIIFAYYYTCGNSGGN